MPIRLRAIDRRFARFCRTGDARSLGAVFDGTAAELLHLAGWLAGNRADAEDLLQQTFLTAIEHRAAFDTERRVLPWLVSILTNHARNLRRERLRRAALPGRPEPVADPVASAAQAEFGAWLAAARAGLGPPYREVLALHLDEGLDAEEIAVRLRRPPGTVRTQIVRGLERLRRRVPTGFVAAAAPCVPADVVVATLTKVRATVTAAARLQSPAAAAGSSATAGAAIVMPMAGGVLVGKAAALASVLVLVAGVAGAVLWGRPGGAVHPTDGARHAAEPRSAPATLAAGATDAFPAGPPARREIVPAPSAQAATAHVRFTGRCVAAEDRTPLGGVEIAFEPTARLEAHAAVAALRGEDREPVAVRTRSEPDGRFTLVGARAPGWQQRLALVAHGRVPVEGYFARGAGEVDLGDIAIPPGVRLTARVVDTNARPVADASLRLDASPARTGETGAAGWLRAQTSIHVRSSVDGSLLVPAPVSAGSWTAVGLDYEVVANGRHDVARDSAGWEIVVDTDAVAITGIVVDAVGAPIAGVAVQPMLRETYTGAVPYTDAEGRFTVRRWSTDRPEPHRLVLTRPGLLGVRTEPIEWGANGLRFVLQPAHEVDLLVVDAGTEAPIDSYGVRVLWDHHAVPGDWRTTNGALQHVGRHERGRLRLRLQDGPHRLCVQPIDGLHAPSAPVLVGVSDALPRQLVVRCPITIPRTIEIVTPAGEPVAGSRIELWRPGGDEFVEWGAEALQWGWPRGSSAVPMLRLLHAVTDGDGRAQIAAVPHERHELRVRGPEHRPLVRAVSFGSEDDPLRIVVSTGATVEGRFAPPEFVERVAALGGSDMPPMVELVRDTGQAFEPHPQQPVAIAADGSFRIERVPPGSWQVVVVAWIGTATRWRARLPVGAPIALGDGDHRELHLDASRSMPCTLRGLVLVNGEPWREQGVTVLLEHDLPMLRQGAGPNGFRATTDADGVFTLTRLPAVYRVRVGDMEASESCRVGPGSITHATFTIVRGTVALRCVDENGCSVEGAFALVTGPGDAQREVRAGVDGRAVVPLPPGPIAVGVLPAALRDPAAMAAFWREHGDEERALRRAAVGAVHGIVDAGCELPLRIVVPSTAGYQGTER